VRKILLAALLAAAPTAAFASCTGSLSGGFTLSQPSMGYLRNASTCVGVTGTAVVTPSTLASVSPAGPVPGNWTLTPLANGSGTVVFAAPGYLPVTVLLTVSLGTLDVDSQ
jgi:hypothetical protein